MSDLPKRSGRASKREVLIRALRDVMARLPMEERHQLAADIGIQPVFNVVFVDAEDGQPARGSDAS